MATIVASKRDPSWRVTAMQQTSELKLMEQFLAQYKPEVVIELGTRSGATALFMHEALPGVPLYTFDLDIAEEGEFVSQTHFPGEEGPAKKEWFGPEVTFLKHDFWNMHCAPLLALFRQYGGRRKFLFVDGDDKPREMILWACGLEVGDLLAVHDWDQQIGYGRVPLVVSVDFERIQHEVCTKLRLQTRYWYRMRYSIPGLAPHRFAT